MSPVRVYPAHADAQRHIFEPFAELPGDCAATGAQDQRDEELAAYRRGVEEGRRQAEQVVGDLIRALKEAARLLEAERRNALHALQHEALRLSLAIARKVVMAELKTNPDAISEIVRRLVSEAEGRRVTRILLHPDDAAHLSTSQVAEMLREADIRVEPSDEISPGGCAIETAFGRLDASLETRLEEIAAALLPPETDDPAGTDEDK